MGMPLWIYICSPLKLMIYAAVMFAIEYGVMLGMMHLIDGVDNKVGTTSKCMTWLFVSTIIAQAVGFGIMGLALTGNDMELVSMLKAVEYSSFDCFKIPLSAYLIGVALVYMMCRFFVFKTIETDDLTRKVAAVIISLFAAPWILMLPIVL